MKSDLRAPTALPAQRQDDDHDGLGYPFRSILAWTAALALAVIWHVARLASGVTWTLTAIVAIVTLGLLYWRGRQLFRARTQSARVFAALGTAAGDIPVKLRTRLPLVLVAGDDLAALFNRYGAERFAHVGNGAIWLRVDRPQDLPRLATAVRQWRDGRAPDGIVLTVVPARHTDTALLTQSLRMVRQAAADITRSPGSRPLPGYIAVYQRLTPRQRPGAVPQWYGVSSPTPLHDTQRFESVLRAAEIEVQHAAGDPVVAARAAACASVVGWTRRVVIDTLTEPRQPAAPWALLGAGWIDCGPSSASNTPWEQDVEQQTGVARAAAAASTEPWPLPQPLIEAMPPRLWRSPRITALAHALALLACSAAIAFSCAAQNNQALLTRIGADLGRYALVPATHDTVKREALQTLVTDRDELDRHARTGVPLHLAFGMYRGTRLIAALDDAIASYVPPEPPPAVVTLDGMSLFDSGRAELKPGSTRVMVGALDLIKAHPDKRILVAGHTDDVGRPDHNRKLSTARAEAVRDWLVDASGLAATRFAIQGYGDTRPIAGNGTAEGRAKNRRVEITLVPDR